jgi:RNA polymerase sigma-54 factor
VKKLQEVGYSLARRTIAKYRDQMGFPVARLRKEI